MVGDRIDTDGMFAVAGRLPIRAGPQRVDADRRAGARPPAGVARRRRPRCRGRLDPLTNALCQNSRTVTDERAIRVFVSSTFRDMQLERDELVKRVFPRIRRLCEQRGVSWSEVDLRWGVTDEQKAEGDVLPICLAEIERTRPYFIGLLGQRYGWVPDEIPAALATELGWLTDDAGRSVTEMEILHGVLNDPEAAGHAFFYLRDPSWVDTVARRRARDVRRGLRQTGNAGSPSSGDRIACERASRRATTPTPSSSAIRCWPTSRRWSSRCTPIPRRPIRSPGRRRSTGRTDRAASRRSWTARTTPALLDAVGRRQPGRRCSSPGPSGIGASALVTHWAQRLGSGASRRPRRGPPRRGRQRRCRPSGDGAASRGRARRRRPDASGRTADTTEDPAALRSMLRQAFSAVTTRR